MSRRPESGVCIFSIDLDSHVARLEDLQLALTAAGIPVTWGVDAALTAHIGDILAPGAGNEVTLLADTTWAGDASNRRRFAGRLTESLQHLAEAGSRPTTLILPNGCHATHGDLLVKHGIRLLRVSTGGEGQHSRGWWAGSRSIALSNTCTALRWGLWQVVTTCGVSLVEVRGAQRVIDRLGRDGGLAVVAASAQHLISDRRTTDSLLTYLVRRQSEGAVRFETLASLSATLPATRTAATARSILHTAA